MVEKITTAEQPSLITLEQRFFITCATFELERQRLMAIVKECSDKGQKPGPEAKASLEQLKAIAANCHSLFEEMIKVYGEDGKLMFRYAEIGLRLGAHRKDCYTAGMGQALQLQAEVAQQATKGEALTPAKPVNVEEVAAGAWLWSGARNQSAALVDSLKSLEMQVAARGFETVSIEDFDNTAQGPLPTLIYGKLFRKRAQGQPAERHALKLRNQHPALKTIVGKKSKAIAK